MQRTPGDSLDPGAAGSTAGETSEGGSVHSSRSTSPRFPIARLDATDRAEWHSKTIGRSSHRRTDVRLSNDQQSPGIDSPASSAPSTPTTALPTSRTYHSLNYAPRQRNSTLRPNAASIFQSHSSQFGQQQAASAAAASNGAASPFGRVSPAQLSPGNQPTSRVPSFSSPLTATSYLSTSPSYPTISLPDAVPPRDSSRARASVSSQPDTPQTSLARMQLQQMQDEARRLGLNEKSAGWLILEALQAATEGEWAAVAELLANGEATLLLPRDPPSVFTSASQLSASFAYDHTIFNASSGSAAKPSPSVVSSSSASAHALPILTLSGLRGNLSRAPLDKSEQEVVEQETPSERFDLTLQSFVVQTSQSPVSNLKDAASRQETLETLAPLPNVASPDDPRCRYPSFSLSASNAQFPLPPPLNARSTSAESQADAKNRSRSNSKLNAAGSKASASFASIFGGSGRERRRQAEAAGTAGSEMIDAQRLPINSARVEPAFLLAADTSQDGSEAVEGAQVSSSLGVNLYEHGHGASNDDTASIKESKGNTAGRRTVSVWVVDHLIRRSAVMRTIRKTLEARIKKRLATAGIPDSICDVVASYAATYLPPVTSSSDAPASRSGGAEKGHATSAGRSRAASPVNVVNPPYLADPDDMSENFQDFFNSIRDQLYKLDSIEAPQSQTGEMDDAAAEVEFAPSATAPLGEERDQHERIERQLEAVETVLCEEVYDRIFCPATSRDGFHDDALASRIAALNVLGLSLRHLGLDVPSEPVEEADGSMAAESKTLLDGLNRIVRQCGAELQRLESASCRSPQAKLEVLVRAHKVAVEGVAELPAIKMREDDADGAGDEGKEAAASESSTTKKTGDSTSADLILPILIYSIVSSNPSHLASNLLYIERFRAESLVQGETSYCLVNVQAAVAFLENVDVKDLGLDSSQIGAHLRIDGVADGGQTPRSSTAALAIGHSAHHTVAGSSATLAMPARIRGRLTQEIGDLAGASNKVITGVMGSSLSAFSRMMGGEANADDVLGRKRTKSNASLNVAQPSDGVLASPAAVRPSSLRSRTASSFTPTDYSNSDEQSREKDIVGAPAAADTKPSIGDRLAMLGRLGASALSSSPSSSLGLGLPSTTANANEGGGLASPTPAPGSVTSPRAVSRELPGPPPPSKPGQNRTTSYLASQLSRIAAVPRSTSSASLAEALPPAKAPLPASLRSPYPPLSRPPTASRPLHVVLASTGSVASVKIPLMVEELLTYANVRVQIVATDNSLHFYDRESIARLNAAYCFGAEGKKDVQEEEEEEEEEYTVASLAAENRAASLSTPLGSNHALPRAHLWTNADEWTSFKRVGDPILHIELRRWADVLLVAPCSANTLAKIHAGMCDDLLTSLVRALGRDTPKYMFPAMNTLMWQNEVTDEQIEAVKRRGWVVKGPVEKVLACGDVGVGAMVEWRDVVEGVVGKWGLVRAAEQRQERQRREAS